jgi:hypothetical protein
VTGINRRSSRRGRGLLVLVVLVVVATAVAVLRMADDEDGGRTASSVCNIAPADSDEAVNVAIASCPDGSTVRFPAGATYHQDASIVVRDRSNLVIDGNGSTFKSSAPNNKLQSVPNWRLFKARNVTLKNMTAVGNFFPTGPRSLATVNDEFGTCEFNGGFLVNGGEGVWLTDLKAHNVCGDGFGTHRSEFFDQGVPNEMPKNIHMIRVEAKTTARMCFGPTQVDGLWIEDSLCQDAWYAGFDAESDGRDDPVKDIHLLRTTFDGYNHAGIFVPVPGLPGSTRDIEIRGNRLLTGPDKVCNQSIQVGGYPDIPAEEVTRVFENVVTEDNEVTALTRAIVYDHVVGGAIRNNRIRELLPPPGFTVFGHCGEDRQVIVTNSSHVVVDEANAP